MNPTWGYLETPIDSRPNVVAPGNSCAPPDPKWGHPEIPTDPIWGYLETPIDPRPNVGAPRDPYGPPDSKWGHPETHIDS